MITSTPTNNKVTKDLAPYKVATLGEYSFTSILSKALVAVLSAEIELTDKLTALEKLGVGNPITYVEGFLNDYMYTAQKFKKTYNPADWESFWKPKFMSYGYPPNILGFLFLKFYQAYQKNLVPKEVWTGTGYGPLPTTTDDVPIGKMAIGGGVVLAIIGIGTLLIFKK